MNDEDARKSGAINPKHRGLGRGLNALFEDGEMEYAQSEPEGAASRTSRIFLNVDQLFPNMYQPRRLFNDETLEELAASFREHGVLQPLMVRPFPGEEDRYQIIAGERRWRAAQMAELHEVPVIITDYDDQKTAEVALIENLQREDLSPIDEAAGFQYMMDEYGYTQDVLAKKMGKSRSHISNILRLLSLPDRVAAYLAAGDLSMGHARALLTVPEADELSTEVVKKGLSVRDTEKMVARIKAKAGGSSNLAEASDAQGGRGEKDDSGALNKSKSVKSEKDADTIALEQDLSLALGMSVSIDGQGVSGAVRISYKSLEQLDELLEKLTHGGGGVPPLRLDG